MRMSLHWPLIQLIKGLSLGWVHTYLSTIQLKLNQPTAILSTNPTLSRHVNQQYRIGPFKLTFLTRLINLHGIHSYHMFCQHKTTLFKPTQLIALWLADPTWTWPGILSLILDTILTNMPGPYVSINIVIHPCNNGLVKTVLLKLKIWEQLENKKLQLFSF